MASRLLTACTARLASLTLTSTTSTLSVTASRMVPQLTTQPVRYASKKSGGVVRNKIGRTKRKHRGIKARHGTFVHQGDVLVTQYGIRFYPGENVKMENDWTLKAEYDGVVMMSTEEVNPYPDSPLYTPIKNGYVMQKQFFNIIPTPLHGKFKLVSET